LQSLSANRADAIGVAERLGDHDAGAVRGGACSSDVTQDASDVERRLSA
jgi:hypothetical protein